LAKQFGVEFDTRDPFQVIADLQNKGINAIQPVPSPLVKQNDASMKSTINVNGADVLPLTSIALCGLRTILSLCFPSEDLDITMKMDIASSQKR